MILNVLKASVATAFALFALSSQAAVITLVGTEINYQYDEADNVLALAMFGTPTIQGNTVRFIPPSFRAESLNGTGADLATANFIFERVYTTNDTQLQAISVHEFGDYKITNNGTVTGDLLLSASNNDDFFAMEISNGDFVSAVGDSGGNQTWTMDASLSPMDEFTVASTDMAVSIQNTLTATTLENGDIAWIQKKLTFVATSEVPVPAAAWLFGSALLGLVGVARRKHS